MVRQCGFLLVLVLLVGIQPAATRVVGSEDAAAALKRGEIMPLIDILAKIKADYEGRMLDVRLEDGGRGLQGWVYAIRLLDKNGNVILLKMDAKTASVLAVDNTEN